MIKSEGKNKFKGCFEKLKGQIWKSRRRGKRRRKKLLTSNQRSIGHTSTQGWWGQLDDLNVIM